MRKQAITISLTLIFLTSAQAAGVSLYNDTVTTLLPGVEIKSDKDSKQIKSATPYQQIDNRKIRETGITDISDAMRRLPGVNLRDYGGAGGLKTVSVRGLGSEHTSVVYDGVSLSDCQSGQIDLARYSLDNVRSLGLYAGDTDDIFMPARAAASASSLYISSFTVPEKDDHAPHLKVKMKAGSFGYYSPYVRYSQRFSERVHITGNAEFIHSKNNYPFTLTNGSIVTRERREHSKMNSWHGELNGNLDLGSGRTLAAKAYWYDNSRDLPGPVIYYVSKSEEHLHEKNFFAQMRFKGRITDRLSLLAIGKFNWAKSAYTDVSEKYPGGMLDNRYTQRETYATASLMFAARDNLTFDYSADWAWNNLTSNTPSAIRPYRHSILQTIAAKYNIGRFSAMARALYSIYVNEAKDGKAGKNARRLSPMASLSFKIMEDADLFVRGSYKNIFRLPTFNEAYFDNYGSVNLDPETTDQWNVGITYQSPSLSWLSGVTVTCDGYINHVRNKIVAIPFNMFLWSMTNLGKVRVIGLDATASAEIIAERGHSFLVNGSYSYQRAQIRTLRGGSDWNNQLAYIPENSGSASLTWLNPWVDLAAHVTACGRRFSANSNIEESIIKSYSDFGISLTRKLTLGLCRMEGRLDIMNIFDKQYEIVARYPMPGRSWRVSVELEI